MEAGDSSHPLNNFDECLRSCTLVRGISSSGSFRSNMSMHTEDPVVCSVVVRSQWIDVGFSTT